MHLGLPCSPWKNANLLTIPKPGRKTFGVVSGFFRPTRPGHKQGPVVATALGAKVIEKHFILDRSIGGADADFSLDKPAFAEMVLAVRDAEKLLGKVDYCMTEKKKKNRRFSRSLYVAEDIKKGEVITEKNVRSVRPGYGLHPKYLKDILGKTSAKDLEKGTALDFQSISEP